MLTPFEQWMVRSNLNTIKNGTPADQIITTLKINGYQKIAAAVSKAVKAG